MRTQVHIHPDERAVALALVHLVVDAIQKKPDLVLGLLTGRTPVRFYRELSAIVARGGVSMAGVTTFNLDEFVGLPPSHPGSYRQFMEKHLFGQVDIAPGKINFLRGDAADLRSECERYDRAIEEAGGIDIQIVGIGTNGHIGFNEPADGLQALTHAVVLAPETRRSNASLFGGDAERVPQKALSMGMASILRARSIVLVATGTSKAGCVERLLNGPITTHLPASFLQLHSAVDARLDEPAAQGLAER